MPAAQASTHPVPQHAVRLVRLGQRLQFRIVELQFDCGHRLLQVPHLAGPDDGRRDAGLLQDPCQRHLRVGDAPLAGHPGDAVHHVEIAGLVIHTLPKRVGLRTNRIAVILAPVVAGHESARQRTPRDHRDALFPAQRQHLALLLAVDDVVVVLHAHEPRQPHFIGLVEHFRELPCVHGRRPEVQRLAHFHHVVERLDGLLDGGLGVEAVDLVEVHVIGPQPPQAVVDGVHDVLARQAALVGVVAHRAEHLGGDRHAVARRPEILERAAQDFFAHAQRIDIRRVEEIDAQLEGAPDERPALLFLQHPLAPLLRAVRHGPEADS